MEEHDFPSNNDSLNSDFFLSDGRKVTSLEDMAQVISRMSSDVFNSHVQDDKNDFANWVGEVHNKKELAEQLRGTKDLNETIKIFYDYSSTTHDLTTHGDSTVSSYDQDFADKQIEIANMHHLTESVENNNNNNNSNSNFDNNSNKSESSQDSPLDNSQKNSEVLADKGFLTKIKDFFLGKSDMADFEDPFDIFENKSSKIFAEENLDVYEPEYLKTDIPGFDELIHEGIPKGSSILLAGGPGTGKTTWSLNLLNNVSHQGLKSLYLTFEEEPARLRSHMRSYGWDSVELEKKGNLKIMKMEPFTISRSIEALLAKASGELVIEIDTIEGIIPEGFKPDIIVLDSLSSVASAFIDKPEGYRIYIEQLFNMFKKIGATSFLISEVEEDAKKYTRNGVEEFLADGVIVLYNLREKNVRVNAIEILKIRGTDHKKKIVPFKIMKGKGIVVFPKESPFTLS